MAWPAAGPSTTITSQSPLRSSCLMRPSTTMSSMPGAAVATTSITPVVVSRRADPAEAVLPQVRLEGHRAGDRLARDIPDEVGEHRLAVELDDEHAEAGRGGRSGEDSRYRCLADAPLARHDRDAGGGELRHRIDDLRRHLCAD